MFNNKKILAVIPATDVSKGFPRKNIRLAWGKPLIAWIFESAKQSRYIDRLISSDAQEIIQVAETCGCEVPFVRPEELAQDNSTASDVISHALNIISGYKIPQEFCLDIDSEVNFRIFEAIINLCRKKQLHGTGRNIVYWTSIEVALLNIFLVSSK